MKAKSRTYDHGAISSDSAVPTWIEADAYDREVVNGKGGNDKLTGLGGSDTFVFSRGYGKDIITDFDFKGTDHDTLDLRKLAGVDSFKDLMAHHIEKSGADVIITGDNGDQVTLSHVKIGNLAAADFLL